MQKNIYLTGIQQREQVENHNVQLVPEKIGDFSICTRGQWICMFVIHMRIFKVAKTTIHIYTIYILMDKNLLRQKSWIVVSRFLNTNFVIGRNYELETGEVDITYPMRNFEN